MNLTLVLSISVPFALASYVPLFTSALTSGLLRRLTDRENETRSRLFYAAIDQLKDLRVRLEEFFEKYDAVDDPLFLDARPRDLQKPVKDYLHYVGLQSRLATALKVVNWMSRVVFWFLVTFAMAMTATIVLGVLSTVGLIGLAWSEWTLAAAGVIFVTGGPLFLVMVFFARRVDSAHSAAESLDPSKSTGEEDESE